MAVKLISIALGFALGFSTNPSISIAGELPFLEKRNFNRIACAKLQGISLIDPSISLVSYSKCLDQLSRNGLSGSKTLSIKLKPKDSSGWINCQEPTREDRKSFNIGWNYPYYEALKCGDSIILSSPPSLYWSNRVASGKPDSNQNSLTLKNKNGISVKAHAVFGIFASVNILDEPTYLVSERSNETGVTPVSFSIESEWIGKYKIEQGGPNEIFYLKIQRALKKTLGESSREEKVL